MKLLKPSNYNPSMVIYNDAPEPTSPWASGTSYAKDDEVLYPVAYTGYTVNHIFKSLVSTNTSTPGTDATKWEDLGVCNKCAAFDRQISSQTTSTTSLTIRIEPNPNYVDAIALMNIVGSEVQVVVTDNGASPSIYNQTFDLETSIITNWYEYFFEPFILQDQLVVTGLPIRENAQITVTVTGAGTVGIGEFIFGSIYTLGDYGTEQGATIGIIDYSRKDTDPNTGVVTFTERAYSKRMSASFYLDNTSLKATQKILADVRAVPSVYIGSDDPTYDSLVIYGFYRDFSIDISYPTRALCRLEIEGLI